jgi:hypothetical protein
VPDVSIAVGCGAPLMARMVGCDMDYSCGS